MELFENLALELEELIQENNKIRCIDLLALEGAVRFNITTTPRGKTVLYSLFDNTAVMVHSPTQVSYVYMQYPTVSPGNYTTIADLEMMK